MKPRRDTSVSIHYSKMGSRTAIFVALTLLNFCAEVVELANTSEDFKIVEIKSAPKDPRSYRGLKLGNGMDVLLIHDHSSEKSAASMVVGVGYLYDDKEVPGIANLTSQVLMMGSEKYQKHYGFNQFLKKHDGPQDGILITVDEETTCYTFDIDANQFEEALEKFAQMFLNPLLLHESKLSLYEAYTFIESQHNHYYKFLDKRRIAQVEVSVMADPNHPITNFKTGHFDSSAYEWVKTKKSKKGYYRSSEEAAVYQRVKDFYSAYYSASIMRLVVVGTESLDDLQDQVTSLFSGVKTWEVNRRRYSFSEHPFLQPPGKPKHKVSIVPLDPKNRFLYLRFPVPDFSDKYNTGFDIYVGYVIIHEGPGGLTSSLENENLCTEVKFENNVYAGLGMVDILFTLTEKGVDRVDYIIKRTFEYIRMLREDGIKEWFFNEIKISNERAFSYYVPTDDPLSVVQAKGLELLDDLPMETIMSREYFRGEWNESVIKEFVDYLRPDNMNVTIVSLLFKKSARQVEKYYGTKYKAVKITKAMVEEWLRPVKKPSIKLQLPSPNRFIPENFDVYDLDEKEPKHPRIIHRSAISEIWFKQDDEFRIPELLIRFELFSSESRFGPVQYVLWHIFHDLLYPILEEDLYSAEVSEVKWVEWNLEINDDEGMTIEVKGLSDKLPYLLEIMLSRITNIGDYLDETVFKRTIAKYIREGREEFMEDHDSQTFEYTRNLMTEGAWDAETVLTVTRILQISDMRNFLQKVFRRIFIRGLIHGNCTKNRALDIVSMVEAAFRRSNGLLLSETLRSRIVELENNSHFIYQTFNYIKQHKFYGYSSYFQFNTKPSNLSDIAGLLLHYLIEEQCEKYMPKLSENRTADCSFAADSRGQRGYFIRTLAKENPRQIDKKLETFLRTIPELINAWMDRQFDSLKDQMDEDFRPADLYALSDLYWYEIENRFYEFDRLKKKIELLSSFKREHLISFAQKMFDTKSGRRRKISTWIVPKDTQKVNPGLLKYLPPHASLIANVFDFKNGSTLSSYNVCDTPAIFLNHD